MKIFVGVLGIFALAVSLGLNLLKWVDHKVIKSWWKWTKDDESDRKLIKSWSTVDQKWSKVDHKLIRSDHKLIKVVKIRWKWSKVDQSDPKSSRKCLGRAASSIPKKTLNFSSKFDEPYPALITFELNSCWINLTGHLVKYKVAVDLNTFGSILIQSQSVINMINWSQSDHSSSTLHHILTNSILYRKSSKKIPSPFLFHTDIPQHCQPDKHAGWPANERCRRVGSRQLLGSIRVP